MAQGIRSLLRWRSVWALLLIAGMAVGFRLYTTTTAEARIAPPLKEAMTHASVFPRVLIRLDFTPEDFHIKYLQRYGMIGGVHKNMIFLLNVKKEDVVELSKIYWIRSIELPQS